MRLGTSGFYGASAARMNRLTAQADDLQIRIATGRRLQAPSDDAVSFRKLQGIAKADADDGVYDANMNVAAGVLAQADTAMSSIVEQLQRASELTLQAANGTLSPENRRAAGVAMAGIVDALTDLANAPDPRGQPLFGGLDGGPAVARAADGSFRLGAGVASAVPIGDAQSVQPSESAERVFGFTGRNGPTDALTLLSGLAAVLGAGGEVPADAIDDLRAAADQATVVRASLGARAARVDLAQAQLADVALDRGEARAAIEGSRVEDMTAAVTELQKTMAILQATQASFSKLQGLSLFDYLR